eukprot:2773732-Amphidinium_carterae.1
MESKHPAPRAADSQRIRTLREVHGSAVPVLDGDGALQALRSFPKGSSGGMSGLRPQHVKDALIPAWRDELLRQLTGFAHRVARGDVPPQIVPWFAGGNLTVLQKPNGRGFRPIAVGEVLRRLVGKMLLPSVQDTVKDHLHPIQLGVGTPLGCEAVAHTVRQWRGRNAGHATKALAQ